MTQKVQNSSAFGACVAPATPLQNRMLARREIMLELTDVDISDLYRVQTHRRPYQTTPYVHNYASWRKQELHDVSMRQLQLSLADFIYQTPISRVALRTTYEVYKQLLSDAEKRIAAETRIRFAPYVLQDGAELLEFHEHSDNARYLDYASTPIYTWSNRPPRRKFLVNVVGMMFPDPDMHYTS